MEYTSRLVKLFRDGKIPEKTIIKMAVFKEELEKVSLAIPDQMATTAQFLQKLPAQKLIAGALLGATALAGGFAGADWVADKFKERSLEKKLYVKFNEMFQINPELSKFDQTKVRQYYVTLARFSPTIASDPVAASAFILQAIRAEDIGGYGPDLIKRVSEVEKLHQEAKARQKPKTGMGKEVRSWMKGVPMLGLTLAAAGALAPATGGVNVPSWGG